MQPPITTLYCNIVYSRAIFGVNLFCARQARHTLTIETGNKPIPFI